MVHKTVSILPFTTSIESKLQSYLKSWPALHLVFMHDVIVDGSTYVFTYFLGNNFEPQIVL